MIQVWNLKLSNLNAYENLEKGNAFNGKIFISLKER